MRKNQIEKIYSDTVNPSSRAGRKKPGVSRALRFLYLIRDQPLCVCVINRFMHLTGSKLSYHLNILKEGGLIEGRYHGNWIIYSLTVSGKK